MHKQLINSFFIISRLHILYQEVHTFTICNIGVGREGGGSPPNNLRGGGGATYPLAPQ